MVSVIKVVKGSLKGPIPEMNVLFEFIISSIYMQIFFHLISWGEKLSEMAQQVCCGFYHFRDMRGPMAKIFIF
jgi:hypothetical protein